MSIVVSTVSNILLDLTFVLRLSMGVRGAGQQCRIRKGSRLSVAMVVGFCILISAFVRVHAESLMQLFLKLDQTDIIAAGCNYLRIEGACYIGIGLLFLLNIGISGQSSVPLFHWC